jgi:hypothetical protein
MNKNYHQADYSMSRIVRFMSDNYEPDNRTRVIAKWEVIKNKIQLFIDNIDDVAVTDATEVSNEQSNIQRSDKSNEHVQPVQLHERTNEVHRIPDETEST